MLSFINMGGKGGKRRQKRGGSAVAVRVRSPARSPPSPEVINIDEKSNIPYSRPGNTSAPLPTLRSLAHSPEIQLEFNHESLMKAFPTGYLKKGSSGSDLDISADDLVVVERPIPDVTRLEGLAGFPPNISLSPSPSSNRRPTPAPIQIPEASGSHLRVKPPSQDPSAIAQSNSRAPSPSSDQEIDIASAISGITLARDIFSNSFVFPSGNDTERNSLHHSTYFRRNGMTRQDSATLPKDQNPLFSSSSSFWKEGPSSQRSSAGDALGMLTPGSIYSVRSTSRSASPVPPVPSVPITATSAAPEMAATSPGPSQILTRQHSGSRQRIMSPPAPTSTPSAQRLGHADQLALHRISRITEAPSPPPSQPGTPERQRARGYSTTTSSTTGRGSPLAPSRQGPGSTTNLVSPPTWTGGSSPSRYNTSPKFTLTSSTDGLSPPVVGHEKQDQDTEQDRQEREWRERQEQERELESFLEDYTFVNPSLDSGLSPSLESMYSQPEPSTPSHSNWNSVSSSRAISPSEARSPNSDTILRDVSGIKSNSGRQRAASGASSSVKRKPVPLMFENNKRSISTSRPTSRAQPSPNLLLPIGDHRRSFQTPASPIPGTPTSFSERRRPSPPLAHLTVPSASGQNISMTRTKDPDTDLRSPDLLDMLIPSGHLVPSISRSIFNRKRTGVPSPIAVPDEPGRQESFMSLKDDGDGDHDGDETPATCEQGQTFPETPQAFSPFSSPEIRSPPLPSMEPHFTPFSRTRTFHPPIVLPLPPLMTESANPAGEQEAEELPTLPKLESAPVTRPQSRATRASTLGTTSPPISPLQPPPTPPPSEPASPSPPAPLRTVSSSETPPVIPDSTGGTWPRKTRSRPPLPIGPRKPGQASFGLGTPPSVFVTAPLATGTASSPNDTRKLSVEQASSPEFLTTRVKWRGYTIEAAKWTFTSEQLQSIVSRAIRQSAEASSIRLLPLDVLDGELPKEYERLEALSTEIRTQYKIQVRKRRMLQHSLGIYAEGSAKSDSATVMRLLEELAEVSTICDQLSEELFSTTDQLAQLSKLSDRHSASALAMALRKLNTSFLKQTAEMAALREEVATLNAERDEAWKQAEEIAQDLDDLNDQMDVSGAVSPSSLKSSSRRSSRVSIARKNSVRASKAGLRSSSSQRRSVRSSSGSASLRVNMSAGARSTFSSDDVPPVPPIPHRDHSGFDSDRSHRSSLGVSPVLRTSSEAGAMNRAQQDLLEMLGISARELQGLPTRPQSALITPHTPRSPVAVSPQLTGSPTHYRSTSLSDTRKRNREMMTHDRETILAMLSLPPLE